MEDKGTALIAWHKVGKPKQHGALGILDVLIHNKALLMKNLFKFLNKEDTPWVKLIWENYYLSSTPDDKLKGSVWWSSRWSTCP